MHPSTTEPLRAREGPLRRPTWCVYLDLETPARTTDDICERWLSSVFKPGGQARAIEEEQVISW